MLIFYFKLLLQITVFIGIYSSQQQSFANESIKVPPPPVVESLTEPLKIQKQNGEIVELNIELALTPEQQAKGLMFRAEIPNDYGMLFVFNEEAPRSFWMKNTLIPLDIIFVKRNGEILHIHENAVPLDLTPIRSDGNAYAVLEINGGLSKTLGLNSGDKIDHSVFGLMSLKQKTSNEINK